MIFGRTAVATSESVWRWMPRMRVLFQKSFRQIDFPVRLTNGVESSQARLRQGSFSRRYLKKSLLITLPKGQTWQGHRRIALNAMARIPPGREC